MKNENQIDNQKVKNDTNVEFGDDLGLNQEAMDVLIATKAGGMITKRLVELGERMLVDEKEKK